MTKNNEFEKFDHAMEELLKVPHSEIKKKLDEEKAEKQKRKAAKKKGESESNAGNKLGQ